MAAYSVTTPFWMRMLFPRELVWQMPGNEQAIYLTFDDGPHPAITPYVLQQLQQHQAKATFFCVGENVTKFPGVYEQVITEGHSVANHTFNHLNGWQNTNNTYIDNIEKAAGYIHSNLFRPPYGRIKRSQAKEIRRRHPDWRIIMWSVLSGDFDRTLPSETCLQNVLRQIKPGAIVVFHDSEKAWDRMSYALPRVLAHCQSKNWQMKAMPRSF